MCLVVVCLWWNLEGTEAQIRSRGSVLFFLPVYYGFNPIFNSVIRTQTERPILRKERQSGTFRLSAYFLTGSLATFICQAVWTTIFVIVAYVGVGFRFDADAFFIHLSALYLSVFIASQLGDFFGFAIENPGRPQPKPKLGSGSRH